MKYMKAVSIIISPVIVCGCLLVATFLWPQKYDYHPFTFDTSNLTDKEMTIRSVKVLGRSVRAGGRYPNTIRKNSIGFSRRDCTPEALLESPAKLTCWEKRFDDPKTKGTSPIDPANEMVFLLPFPEFDVDEHEWACHFTLQSNFQCVGQYDGVKVKPIGVKPDPSNSSSPNQQWIHMQFRSSRGTRYFSDKNSKLICGDAETLLFIPEIPGDGKFHGFAAHSPKGSIYRPLTGSKLVFEWGAQNQWDTDQYQEIELPRFSEKQKSWYCYFTLGEDEKWSAVFEGVAESKKEADDSGAAK